MIKKNKIIEKDKAVSKETLKTYIKQPPNKSIFGLKFYLWVYNLSNESRPKWPHSWFRKIGEEPVILDPLLIDKSSNQLKIFLDNSGYYHSQVYDSVVYKKKKASVYYIIEPNEPFTINSIRYLIEDEQIAKIVFADTVNSLIHSHTLFSIDQLLLERERIERVLKREGYFSFSKEYIYYEADTSAAFRSADITLGIKKFYYQNQSGYFYEYPHRTFYIHSVSLFPDYTNKAAPNDSIASVMLKQQCDNISIFYTNRLSLKPNVLCRSISLLPGSLYNIDNVERTYRNIASLRNYKTININFQTNDTIQPDTIGRYPLDCRISMAPSKKQSYNWELVSNTNSGSSIGFGMNLIYMHKNIFRGAESFSLKLNGSLEYFRETDALKYNYDVEARFVFPKFLLPFSNSKFIKDNTPRTSLILAYNHQKTSEYIKTIANVKFGYSWKAGTFVSHILNPIEISAIDTNFVSPEYLQEQANNPYALNSVTPHFISSISYSYIYNDQRTMFDKDYLFYRINTETSGNLIYLISDWTNQPLDSMGRYKIFGTPYSQYIKADIDLHYSIATEQENNNIVFRLFVGVGYPYLNSSAMPFERSYSVGGASSMRAWQSMSLGPGSYKPEIKEKYPSQTGDIRIEGNIEYRYKLFWKAEGAAFLDIGNVWTLRKSYNVEGTQFKLNSFMNDLAVGSGAGLRFNFDFFILRFDVGIKIKDPADDDPGVPDGKAWILGNRAFSGRDFDYNIAIGYPF